MLPSSCQNRLSGPSLQTQQRQPLRALPTLSPAVDYYDILLEYNFTESTYCFYAISIYGKLQFQGLLFAVRDQQDLLAY